MSVPVLECPGEWSNDCGCPERHNYCWPRPDTGCCPDLQLAADAPPDRVLLVERMLRLSVEIMHAFSARQFGLCPRLVRPCREECGQPALGSYGSLLEPYVLDGSWYNNVCRRCTSGCSCTSLSEVLLPGPVEKVLEVTLDGAVVDPADYRVDNHRRLVALNGLEWPTCQDMGKPLTAVGTFGVSYQRGKPVPEMGLYAAGMVACELVKACTPSTTGDCRLPANVQSLAREGVSYDLAPFTIGGPDGKAEFGRTGVPEADMWIAAVNPRRTTGRSRAYSPDRRPPRRTTWPCP